MDNLINKIAELEIKVMVYSENWGPNSAEVKQLDREITQINLQILDLMVQGE